MNKVKIWLFKENGTFYTEEEVKIPRDKDTMDEIREYIATNTSFADTKYVIIPATEDFIKNPYPCMLLCQKGLGSLRTGRVSNSVPTVGKQVLSLKELAERYGVEQGIELDFLKSPTSEVVQLITIMSLGWESAYNAYCSNEGKDDVGKIYKLSEEQHRYIVTLAYLWDHYICIELNFNPLLEVASTNKIESVTLEYRSGLDKYEYMGKLGPWDLIRILDYSVCSSKDAKYIKETIEAAIKLTDSSKVNLSGLSNPFELTVSRDFGQIPPRIYEGFEKQFFIYSQETCPLAGTIYAFSDLDGLDAWYIVFGYDEIKLKYLVLEVSGTSPLKTHPGLCNCRCVDYISTEDMCHMSIVGKLQFEVLVNFLKCNVPACKNLNKYLREEIVTKKNRCSFVTMPTEDNYDFIEGFCKSLVESGEYENNSSEN